MRKECEISFGKPVYGWSTIQFSNIRGDVIFEGMLSDIDDVPAIFLNAFKEYLNNGTFQSLEFDEEGSEFLLIPRDVCLYIISERDKMRTMRVWSSMDELIETTLDEFERHFEQWSEWGVFAFDEDRYKIELSKRKEWLKNEIDSVRKMIEKKKGELK